MARKLETTLWQLVKADGKSRYVKLRKADNGRWSTGVEGEHGSFYLRYTLNGKRKWESVGDDLMAAVSELKARQAMVVNGKGQAPVSSRKTMAEAIQSYLKEVHTLRGQRSMERDKWLLELFSSVIGRTYMDEVSRDTLFFFMAYLKNAGKSPKTKPTVWLRFDERQAPSYRPTRIWVWKFYEPFRYRFPNARSDLTNWITNAISETG